MSGVETDDMVVITSINLNSIANRKYLVLLHRKCNLLIVSIYLYMFSEQAESDHQQSSRASTIIFEERLLGLGRVGALQLPPSGPHMVIHLVELFRPRVETLAVDMAAAATTTTTVVSRSC